MNNTNMFDLIFKGALGLHRYEDYIQHRTASNFPPYNVLVDNIENPSHYIIELAVAGFSKSQLSVKLRKDTGIPVLLIEGLKGDEPKNNMYAVRGLAARSFSREFTISNDMNVTDISLNDGILTIKLEVVKQKDTEFVLQIK